MSKPIYSSPVYVRGKDGKLYEIDRKSTDENKSDYEKYSIFKLNEDFSKVSSEFEVTELTNVDKQFKNPIDKSILTISEQKIKTKNGEFVQDFDDPNLYAAMKKELNSFQNNSKVDQPSQNPDTVKPKQNSFFLVQTKDEFEILKKDNNYVSE